MKTVIILSLVFVAVIFISVSATIIDIPDDYPTIQQGIDASSDGDTVLVQPGTYFENVNFNGHNIVLGSLFLTTGDTTYIGQTIIDGDSSGSVVTFENGEDSSTVISGFTIQNGYNYSGGGIFCSNSSPIIGNNIISGNVASEYQWYNGGGGIYCQNANPIIANNIIRENIAAISSGDVFGGGIFCENSNATIIGNIIEDNETIGSWSYAFGGGIGCWNSDPIIAMNIISGNAIPWAEWCFGGGIGLCSSNPLIDNNIITGNFSDYYGGSIGCYDHSSPVITNNTIYANDAFAGGFYCEIESNPLIINTIFWGNPNVEIYHDESSSPYFSYCDIEGGWDGEGNIDTDPLFRDPENGDFHLKSTECGDAYDSPCIDTGSPEIFDSLLDCSWGLGTTLSDMGAYGGGIELGGCNYIVGDANGDRTANGLDVVYMVDYLKGGPAPPDSCDCPPHGYLLVAADANGSCSVNGLDVTFMVSYYKGGPALLCCEDCPSGLPRGG